MIRKRRIGILGGSFDPIHVGHLSVAQQAADRLGLAEVVLVPVGRPPHKSREMAPAADRLAMARLAIRGLARLSVSDVEVNRSGRSYTIDTVRELKQRLGADHEYWFIIGADTVGELPTWHRAAELLEEIPLAVAVRPGSEPDFSAVEAALGRRPAARLRRNLLEIEPCDVSSTQVRRLAREGQDITPLVRAGVAGYIAQKGLYRGEPDGG
jgi:nicotinate-nucleotide adenylyltransferase